MKTVIRVLFLLLVAAASSCVVFPIHPADENPFGSQSIGFIVPGDTPRIEIESQFGAPHRVYSEGRWWLYHADRRMTTWFLFVGAFELNRSVLTQCGRLLFQARGGDLRPNQSVFFN